MELPGLGATFILQSIDDSGLAVFEDDELPTSLTNYLLCLLDSASAGKGDNECEGYEG